MTHYNEGFRAAAVDGSRTGTINHVLGARDDASTTDTIAGRVHSVEEHEHSASRVYPTLADGITVTAEAVDWGTGGALVEIVPADTITEPFDIHFVNIENVSAARTYELIFYWGATDTEAGRIRFTKSAGLDPVLDRRIQTRIIPANSRIRARLASAGAVADTVDVSVHYHVYD